MDCCEDPMTMYRVVCPKPRRVASPHISHVSLAPSRFHIRNDVESNDGAELLGLILRQEQSKASVSSPPPFSLGSPPCRSQNPVIQDVGFGVTFIAEALSTEHAREQLGKKQAAAPKL